MRMNERVTEDKISINEYDESDFDSDYEYDVDEQFIRVEDSWGISQPHSQGRERIHTPNSYMSAHCALQHTAQVITT